jgi:hypothetical protein
MKKVKEKFQAKQPKSNSINNNEIISEDTKVKKEETFSTDNATITEKDVEEAFFIKMMGKYIDKKIRFAKVNWGVGKGPYILAFENSSDYSYCECNAHEFKPLKDSDIKQNHIHIWECGSKLPEQINKLPTLDIEKYKQNLKNEKLKKKEEKDDFKRADNIKKG